MHIDTLTAPTKSRGHEALNMVGTCRSLNSATQTADRVSGNHPICYELYLCSTILSLGCVKAARNYALELHDRKRYLFTMKLSYKST